MIQDLYTVGDIERMFDYTSSGVYRLIRTGDLKAEKINGRYFIEKESLEDFVKNRTATRHE